MENNEFLKIAILRKLGIRNRKTEGKKEKNFNARALLSRVGVELLKLKTK